MTETPRELWFVGPRQVVVRAGESPRLLPGHAVLRALVSGVSQGTEMLLYRGEGPTPFDPSLDAPGTPTYPRRYGYAWVGEVVLIDEVAGAAPIAKGTRVFALAPHGDAHVLPADSARPLPSSVPTARAVLAANLEAALTCVWDARISIGDEVVVLGGGVVGLLVAWLAARAGAWVCVVEPSARRREVALQLGARTALSPDADVPRAQADVVVEATGDPASLDRAIAHAGKEGTIVVASFYGARTHPVTLGAAFHRSRLTLRSTQVSAIPPDRAPRWTLRRRFRVVGELLQESALDLLLDDPFPFDEAPRAYAEMAEMPGDRLQTSFVYR
jgi:2-desacetyl-2-hydroxyethyl bacteriochlorophyllide A dehydrogenase